MADATGDDADQHFVWIRFIDSDILYRQRLAPFTQHGSFHEGISTKGYGLRNVVRSFRA